MARHYAGLSRATALAGAQPTIDTSSTGLEVEISVLDGVAGLTKLDIAVLVEKCVDRIIADREANFSYP
jgi:hypothetical protein